METKKGFRSLWVSRKSALDGISISNPIAFIRGLKLFKI